MQGFVRSSGAEGAQPRAGPASAASESAASLSKSEVDSSLSPGKRTCPGQQAGFGLEAPRLDSRPSERELLGWVVTRQWASTAGLEAGAGEVAGGSRHVQREP